MPGWRPDGSETAVSLLRVGETVTLTVDVYRAMLDRALTEAPKEACGLFTGPTGGLHVDDFHPIANTAPEDEAWKLYVLH